MALCWAFQLPEQYFDTYMPVDPHASTVFKRSYPLGVIKSCYGDYEIPLVDQSSPKLNECSVGGMCYNRAKIALEDNLLPGYKYGFELVVTLPGVAYYAKYDLKKEENWQFKMSTVRASGEELDRTYYTMPYSPTHNVDKSSFEIYKKDFRQMPRIVFADNRPFRLTQHVTFLTTPNGMFEGSGKLNITAPPGYIWDYGDETWRNEYFSAWPDLYNDPSLPL